MPLTFILALALATPSSPPQCRDAHGKLQPCPQSPVAYHCHDVKGREARCGAPGAKPAGLKTEKPGARPAPQESSSPHS